MNENVMPQSVIRKYHRKCQHHNLKRNYHHFSNSIMDDNLFGEYNEGYYGNRLTLVAVLPLVPLCIVIYGIMILTKKTINRAYYHYNRNKNVLSCSNKVGVVKDFAKASSIVVDKNGKRAIYDEEEVLRREKMKHERRKITHRRTINHKPTPDEVMEKWQNVKRSYEDMLRFGSILCDLEAYVDNSLIKNEAGEIVGRQSGIKGWLKMHCPDIAMHYSRAMRFKALTIRFRQILKIYDPYPATIAIDGDEAILEAMRNPNPLTGELLPMDDRERTKLYAKINWEMVAVWRKQAIELIKECETKAPKMNKSSKSKRTEDSILEQIEISDNISDNEQSNIKKKMEECVDASGQRDVQENGDCEQGVEVNKPQYGVGEESKIEISDNITHLQDKRVNLLREVNGEKSVNSKEEGRDVNTRVVIAWLTKVLESHVDSKEAFLRFVEGNREQFA